MWYISISRLEETGVVDVEDTSYGICLLFFYGNLLFHYVDSPIRYVK